MQVVVETEIRCCTIPFHALLNERIKVEAIDRSMMTSFPKVIPHADSLGFNQGKVLCIVTNNLKKPRIISFIREKCGNSFE